MQNYLDLTENDSHSSCTYAKIGDMNGDYEYLVSTCLSLRYVTSFVTSFKLYFKVDRLAANYQPMMFFVSVINKICLEEE